MPAYDPALPITAWHDEIAGAIRDHQVLIVAGETGSGKTTQLPKICLELGRRSIGHTQPRRIAARTVSERIAEELNSELGDLVGYQVRFTRKSSRATRLKVMTDGVLLAEIGHDRDLRRYDTIIIDEAHERSLNIDFLLGYLKQLITRRADLKIIITSATIDTERFATHFADADGNPAPIIEVSGRTFPVEVRYRPLLRDGEADQLAGIADAVKELMAVGDGDILVFLSGEREIRDAADSLGGLQLRFTEILPLYARLSAADQHRVFAAHAGRRVVLATNVAETSLTVPGIRYVVDAGMARISRYSARTKVQRLPIEPISQASANQRAGRCGRVAPGVCIRLYSEEDFGGRPEFTEPEILRTNLASVILQMTAADLGEISSFPFVEAPDGSQITDGLRLLGELGALSERGTRERPQLTTVGQRLAAIPVDPRMGRMLLAADDQGCLREMLIIVAGLSIQDPRERPPEQRDKADALHRRFWAITEAAQSTPTSRPSTGSGNASRRSTSSVTRPPKIASDAGDSRTLPDPIDGHSAAKAGAPPDGSDFIALLNLWDYLRDQQQALSGNAFRRLCRDEFLHFLRTREWQDLHTQLKQICRELGLQRNEAPAAPDRVHTAALAGLLSHVGLAELREDGSAGSGRGAGSARKQRRTVREYLGARGTRFAINPGSSVARIQPPLVMAAEIVETTRLWARTVGADPGRAGRGSRRSPAEAPLLRTALVRPGRVGDGVRDRESVRDPDRGPAPGRLRQDQPGRGTGDLRPVGSRRGAVADPAPLLPRQPGGAGRGRGARGAGPAPGSAGRRRDHPGLLRCAGAGRHHLGRALRRLVEEGPTSNARSVDHDLGRSHHRHHRRRSGPRLPDNLDHRRGRARGQLCLRSDQRSGRSDRRRAGFAAQPTRSGPVQLAGARPAGRTGHRADPVAAEAGATVTGAGAGVRGTGARLAGPASGPRHRGAAGCDRPGPAQSDRRPDRDRGLGP